MKDASFGSGSGSGGAATTTAAAASSLPPPPKHTARTIARTAARTLVAVLVGAGLGMALSVLVNACLLEISLNEFFRIYFGALLVAVGCVIAYRVNRFEARAVAPLPRRILVTAFALLVVCAGVVSACFQTSWFLSESVMGKLGVYSLLAMALSFVMATTLVEVVALSHDACVGAGPWSQRPTSSSFPGNANSPRPLLSSERQVALVVVATAALGLAFGLTFALVDVGAGAERQSRLVAELRRDEAISLPVGAVVGGLCALLNELMRSLAAESSLHASNGGASGVPAWAMDSLNSGSAALPSETLLAGLWRRVATKRGSAAATADDDFLGKGGGGDDEDDPFLVDDGL